MDPDHPVLHRREGLRFASDVTYAEWAVLTDAAGRAHPFSLAPGQPPEARADLLRAEALRMVAGRLALLGDAAFVVRPHTGLAPSSRTVLRG